MRSPLRRPALWALTGGAFVAEWVAVATANRSAQLVAKPSAMAALTVAAADSGLAIRPWGRPALAGMLAGLGGDVALLGRSETAFRAGLASFLAGHLGYLESFRRQGLRATPWIVPGALGLAACMAGSRELVPAVWGEGVEVAGPVIAYMGVIGAMSLAAWATGDPVTGTGATLFVLSDTVLAVDKFVRPVPQAGLAVMVPYLTGQALIAIGSLRRTPSPTAA